MNLRPFLRWPNPGSDETQAGVHQHQWVRLMMLLVALLAFGCLIPLVLRDAWPAVMALLLWVCLPILLVWQYRQPERDLLFHRFLLLAMLTLPLVMHIAFGGLYGGSFMALLALLAPPMNALTLGGQEEEGLWLGLFTSTVLLSCLTECLTQVRAPLTTLITFYAGVVALGWGVALTLSYLSLCANQAISRAQALSAELAGTRERLDKASKAKDDFLANMSHEIRTPMHAISGMADMLLLSDQLGPTEVTQAENIKQATQNLLGLIGDILDISKMEAGKLELFEERYDFPSMFHDVVSIISMRAREKNLAFLSQLDPEIPKELVGDSMRIRQVLLNLLGNAVKFTDRGSVALTVQRLYRQDQPCLYFEVNDTGAGIHPQDYARLYGVFEQLETTRAHNREGTGLGLAISRRLVELMGGELGMRTKVGQGTTFFFTITQQNGSDEPIAQVKNPREKRLLICSDSPSLAQHIVDMAARLKVKAAHGLPSEAAGYTHLLLDLSAEESYAWVRLNTPPNCQRTLLMDPATPLTAFIRMTDRVIFHPLHIITLASLLEDTFTGQTSSATRALRECIFQTKAVRVLVIDDNQVSAMVAANLLRLYGTEVDQASTGAQGIAMLESKAYDLVFVDHIMPEMDGLETVRHIRRMGQRFAKQIIIALSANVMPESRKAFLAAGMTDTLAKPIELPKVSALLRTYLPVEKCLLPEPRPAQDAFLEKQREHMLAILSPLGLARIAQVFAQGQQEPVEALLLDLQRCQAELAAPTARLKAAVGRVSRVDQLRPSLAAVRSHMTRLGEARLTAQAKLLDQAIAIGDLPYAQEHIATHLGQLCQFLTHLSQALGRLNLPPLPPLTLTQALEQLQEALLDFDFDGARARLSVLERQAQDEDLKAALLPLRQALDTFNHTQACDLLEELLVTLNWEDVPLQEVKHA